MIFLIFNEYSRKQNKKKQLPDVALSLEEIPAVNLLLLLEMIFFLIFHFNDLAIDSVARSPIVSVAIKTLGPPFVDE